MYAVEMCRASVLGGPINFILGGWHEDDPSPIRGAQNGCHGSVGCLTIGPRNLHFMAAYFKNYKVYTL